MEANEHLRDEGILEQYRMRQKEADSVTAWSKEYGIEDILDDYLEKSGYPTSQPRTHRVHAVPFRDEGILEQYKMRHNESQSVSAWSREYGIDDILDDYLEKSGYPTRRYG